MPGFDFFESHQVHLRIHLFIGWHVLTNEWLRNDNLGFTAFSPDHTFQAGLQPKHFVQQCPSQEVL